MLGTSISRWTAHPAGLPCTPRERLHSPRCVTRCTPDTRQIFQLTPSRQNVTFDDVWEAGEMCDLLDGRNRAECYASYGIDVERTDEYLGRALALEALYRRSKPEGHDTFHVPALPFLDMDGALTMLQPADLHHSLQHVSQRSLEQVQRLRDALFRVQKEFQQSADLMFSDAFEPATTSDNDRGATEGNGNDRSI